MKIIAFLIFSLFFALAIAPFLERALAQTIPPFEKIVDAIYLAEGGLPAKRPFGILSVPCRAYDECRRVCLNTVRNNYYRWIDAGMNGPYLEFLASRYAPIGVENDPTGLNKNWISNVRYFIAQESLK